MALAGTPNASRGPHHRLDPNNVHRQVQRFGLGFRAAAAALSLQLPPDATSHFEAAATKRGLSHDAMIHKLLLEVAADPSLLDNILDDGV